MHLLKQGPAPSQVQGMLFESSELRFYFQGCKVDGENRDSFHYVIREIFPRCGGGFSSLAMASLGHDL